MRDERTFETSIPNASGKDLTITIRLTDGGCDIAIRPREQFEDVGSDGDSLEAFLRECCRRAPKGSRSYKNYEVRADIFRRSFDDYCSRKSLRPITARRLGIRLAQFGIGRRKSCGRIVYCGLQLSQAVD